MQWMADIKLLNKVSAKLVKKEWAERVVSPAYDMLRTAEREKVMKEDPYVFLHVTSAKSTFTEKSRTDANKAALKRLLKAGVYSDEDSPSLYLYKLSYEGHQQTAIVGDISIEAFEDQRVIPHERTRELRAIDLANHLEKIGIHSSPVALAYDHDDLVDRLVAEVFKSEPILDFCREDNLEQTIWKVPETITEQLLLLFEKKKTFIVDGHHRMNANHTVWLRSNRNKRYGKILAALFSANELKIRSFHRHVTDLNGLTPYELTTRIAEMDFHIEPVMPQDNYEPEDQGQITMFLDGNWYKLSPQRMHPSELDAAILQNRILTPLLNVDEEGSDGRLQYLPGTITLEYLESMTREEGGVAFALHPVSMDQLQAVINRKKTLPPKSTYFEPKVRSGIFIVER
ncbi:MAG: hypothetical protein CL431_07735 [Acidimicrobiaceae bacterium]|nr:hypothetical protein [Acidimicrobiaceae bacterium]